MAEETQYTANTGMVNISAANPHVDGSGDVYTVLTGNEYGTLVKTVTIKAIEPTEKGMIRLYIGREKTRALIAEVEVDAITPSATEKSFEKVLNLNLSLTKGFQLLASTQNANSFNIIAEGLDTSYYSTVRLDGTQYAANTGIGQVSIANPNLDGTGDITKILTSGTLLPDGNGCSIKSFTIKGSYKSATEGMIRIFIGDGAKEESIYLFTEVPVIQVLQALR